MVDLSPVELRYVYIWENKKNIDEIMDIESLAVFKAVLEVKVKECKFKLK